MTRKLRCTVEYDGTAFAGFQRQPGRTTVQGALEAAIARVVQEPVAVVGAGRTDTGVHALGQVIHFTTESSLPVATLQRAVNACLPSQVAVRDLAEAADNFHARYSAHSREYRYVVDNGEAPSPLCAQRAYHLERPLAVDAMQEAAQLLCGRHDFARFGSPMQHTVVQDGETVQRRGHTVRTLLAARCWRVRRFVLFCFIADAFLRHMVRLLVGTLLRVGAGSLATDEMMKLLQGDPSVHAGPAVPAHGLYLVRVRY